MKNIYGFALFVVFVAAAFAQEHEHASAGMLGAVHFETSCAPAAQVEFDRAVALLHSFQFSRAQTAFHAVLKTDPQCAMAYWGLALADWSNPFAPGIKPEALMAAGARDVKFGMEANPKTERERAYLDAVGRLFADQETAGKAMRPQDYRDAMEKVAAKYPQDSEAQIFYALSLAAAEPLGDKKHLDRLKAGAILEKLFKDEPEHPGLAHYIIHTYDVPGLADKAVDAARRYSKIAPDAPHALHMPSHTFTRVGYWQESIDANIAAAKAAGREQQVAEELHASDYQAYAYLQTGQDAAALKLIKSLPEIKSRFDPKLAISGAASPASGYYAMAAIPARYALERQDWKSAAAIEPDRTPIPYADAISWFARGLGAARLKQIEKAQGAAHELQSIVQKLSVAHEVYWMGQVSIQEQEVNAWAELASGNNDLALKTMNEAAKAEDATDKSAVTPGPLAPARELLGEMFLQMAEPKLALEQFELTLKKEPGRFRSLYGAAHAAKLVGDKETSRKYSAKLLKSCERGDKPGRAELAEARKQ